jgi:crotonobetaine/carnitine-CoA ligase
LPRLLERQTSAHAEAILVRDGARERTYSEMRDHVAAFAGTLAGTAGIGPGDRVSVICENKLELLDIWLACGWLGAIMVPINTALRGTQLEHELESSGARLLVIDAELLPQLDSVESPLPALERVWVVGEGERQWRGRDLESLPGPSAPVPAHPSRPGDTAVIHYTSGTTGPSKGVVCPHAQSYWWGILVGEGLGIRAGDVLYTCLPLFHTNALNAFAQALLAGATYVIGPHFSASRFWQRVAEAEATVTYLLGAMVTILDGRPPGPEDTAHRVRVALAPATPAELHEAFRERFGIVIVDGYGSTETNAVIGCSADDQRPGFMGRVKEGFEARVVDEDDEEVPDGTPGELVLRHSAPFSFASGYFGEPEKTVEAWRNLWFHSGDRVVRDEDGYFRFLDRIKDAIRRRGENISAWEVERALQSHPDVETAAVIPVPSELGEDDVMACVVLRERVEPDPEGLLRHCETRLAYFAVPRYVDFVAELPLTSNGKVAKFRLRERGVTPTTWDREKAGFEIRR